MQLKRLSTEGVIDLAGLNVVSSVGWIDQDTIPLYRGIFPCVNMTALAEIDDRTITGRLGLY